MKLTAVGDQVAAGGGTNYQQRMELDIPKFRYSTYAPNIGGPGRIVVNFTGRGMIDPTSLYSLQVTFVNTRASNYTLNVAT